MTTAWHPLQLFTHPRRVNRALAEDLDEDTAPVVAELARLSGRDHAYLVVHVGPTTRPQTIVWPMTLRGRDDTEH